MALAYLWYLYGDKIQKYIGGLSEKVYLQMSSDPILCKLKKASLLNPLPRRASRSRSGKLVSVIVITVRSIRFDIPGEGAGILKAGLNSVGYM